MFQAAARNSLTTPSAGPELRMAAAVIGRRAGRAAPVADLSERTLNAVLLRVGDVRATILMAVLSMIATLTRQEVLP